MDVPGFGPVGDAIKHHLTSRDNVEFVIGFGSIARGNTTPMSDVDIGIHFSEIPSLLRLGALVTGLENIAKRPVDIIVLNELYRKKPEFCFSILKTGVLLLCNNRTSYVEFKRETILTYLDIRPMRETVKASLMKRIREGKAGQRNYAGTT